MSNYRAAETRNALGRRGAEGRRPWTTLHFRWTRMVSIKNKAGSVGPE